MANTWTQDGGDLEVSLEREDSPNRPTMITIKDRSSGASVVIQLHDARWLIDRLNDAIAGAEEHC